MFIALLSVFTGGSAFDSLNSNSEEPIECVSLNNHSCQDIPTLVDINSDETLLYPFNVTINKHGGSCTTIDDPYGQVCYK